MDDVERTFLDWHTPTLLVRLYLVPEHHPHLSILQCPCDIDLALLLQLLDSLWCLFPTLLQRADGEPASLSRLPLNLCEKRSFISYIEVMLTERSSE